MMGKFYLEGGSVLVQPSAASPIVNRIMDEKHKAVRHAESNFNLRVIVNPINDSSFSRVVTTAEDTVSCLDGSTLKSNPPTVTKANAPYFDSRLDSSCPGSRIISLKRHSENGPNKESKRRNAVRQACNGASTIRDHELKELVGQQTTIEGTSSPEYSRCNENAIDINNASIAVDVDSEPIVADIDNESTIDSDIGLIESSDDESISPTPRFDRFSNSDGPSTPRRKIAIDDSLSPKNDGEGSSDSLLEAPHRYASNRDTDELLLEASAKYRLSRKRNIEYTNPNRAKINPVAILDSPRQGETCETSALDRTGHPAADNDVIDLVGTNKTCVQNSPITCCKLPFNGHREDNEHYRLCSIILAGFVLRGEHTKWLRDIPSHSGTMRAVNLIIGPSCKQIILSGKCSEEHCTSKIDLNLNIPKQIFKRAFNVFTKWFFQNAQEPNLKVILLLLSHAPKDHHNILMTVLTFAKIIVKLSNSIHRQALSIKLKEIMVNILEYKPWEAVRTLLVFSVTPETELSEIVDLLSMLEVKSQPLKNRLYESVSCLWHINDRFACPADLLFELLKECLVQMPVELKFTKDRMVADLLKLPRKSLRKEFLIVDKFLDKYYPQNSEVSHLVKTSIFCNSDVTKSSRDCQSYETSRVKGTGPVNSHWEYWDIREAQMKGFDLVIKNSQKDKSRESIDFRRSPPDLSKERFEVDLWGHDLFKIVTNRNILCYDANIPSYDFSVEKSNDFERLDGLLTSGKCSQVVKIISSCGDSKSLETCLNTLKQKFELGGSSDMAFAILERLPGSLKDKTSVKSTYVSMLNSLVMKFYKDSDYKSALTFLKLLRIAGVNHMDHVPKQSDLQTFAVICSDINLECRLYKEAIRSLMYEDCLNFLGDPNNKPEKYHLLEKLVKNMFRRFLKERHASHAVDIFRIILTKQKSLHSPLDIGKYFEGVIFLSFVRDLKKNACSSGTGANLYTSVERICGNSEPFHSITYRSLLVELHREKSPEDIIKRVLRICLEKKIYPDFSRGPISPLVLDSHLAKEEISIYLKYYFNYFITRNDLGLVKTRPFVVKFLESARPDRKVFPIPNDIMKTSRSVPDALERFRSVLNEISHTLDADVSENCVTISVQDVETLIRVFTRQNLPSYS